MAQPSNPPPAPAPWPGGGSEQRPEQRVLERHSTAPPEAAPDRAAHPPSLVGPKRHSLTPTPTTPSPTRRARGAAAQPHRVTAPFANPTHRAVTCGQPGHRLIGATP